MIAVYLPWIISAFLIAFNWMAGSKMKGTWSIALFQQVLWFVWVIDVQAWGLLPGNIALTVVFARNWLKWHNENGEPK